MSEGQVEKQSQVLRQVELIQGATNKLIERVSETENRLSWILKMQPPSEQIACGKEPEALVSLAEELRTERGRIESQVYRLEDILQRLEL